MLLSWRRRNYHGATAQIATTVLIAMLQMAGSVGGLFHLSRSATFGAGTKLVLFAQANRMHASVLACPVALRAAALDFLLVSHLLLSVDRLPGYRL